MKKLALTLGALALVGTTAMAGEFKATDFNQELEFEHSKGSKVTTAFFTTTVGLKYEDWSFGVQGGKQWSHVKKSSETRIQGDFGRIQLDAWKKINPDFKLGYRLRSSSDYDRHYLRYVYNFGDFSTSGDIFYNNVDGDKKANDKLVFELTPIQGKIGPVTAKLFVEYDKFFDAKAEDTESAYEVQGRFSAPLYSEGAFSLGTELRLTLVDDAKVKNKENGEKTPYNVHKNFGKARLYLKANYKLSESTDLYANVFYQHETFKAKNGDKKDKNTNTKNVVLGWTYKF